MKELAIFLSKSLLGWLVIQMCLSLVFLLYVRTWRSKNIPDEQLPKAAVIICLRGADPFLPNCLEALLQQNYPNYDLKVVVDSQDDPAWKIASDSIDKLAATNAQINHLRVIRHNCSLKCSSLIQAISDLDDSYQVVALADADTIVHPHWLRELVSPLGDPKIGATTGNRWYVPTNRYWGSLVRYTGNIATVVQMYLFGIPWGGTLAVKTQVLRQTGLLEKWAQSFGEDLMMPNVLKKHGLRVKFVPSLIMVNREECDLLGIIEYLQRFLLYSRLYHPQWLAIVSEAVSSILFPTLSIIVFLLSLGDAQWDVAGLLLNSYSIYTLGLLLLMVVMEIGLQPVICAQGQPGTQLSITRMGKMLLAIPLTQWVYGLAMLSSVWISTVKWRGIIYRIHSHDDIRLVEYHAYDFLDQPIDSKMSL
ncbi:Glycosyl transferase, family 2 [Trichormus variabilis ATCC 29413]|uniref:Glycosyl transferase, family 2 n=2 Tax=Anabaena variabilis TaxID=264691 RepID=Q3M9Y8_TRIV2|nr:MULTISPECIES: glycosyltransferase family 2 protein [Nostocaceae]ABA22198.1 Glycosyl transferase, family 2 [Trichormus variabilis ATCC 29413]MBC1217676.1 glycosyltransferase family 2 protein [Trichormus variabilis ARAD]MBC1255465.1 glycosyltransferase family 2 protein [Trichormus variabilis V5]MBC1269383.1 glycosyltransferase family 2 protein [Trichormus variabilis FSR]MBC1301262.1 glycosyltransferase family 2 protein [Trichormus variabilis N2B]